MLIALTAAAAALSAALYVVPDDARLWTANAAWTLAGAVAVLGVAAAWRASRGADRGAWRIMFGAAVAWLAGMVFWDVYAATSFPPSPSVADLCWLGFAASTAAAVHRMGRSACRGTLVRSLEVVPLVVAVCSVVIALLWDDIVASPLPASAALTAVAYPIFYVSAALVLLQAVVVGAIDLRRNAGMAALLAGLLIDAVAFILWAPMLLGAAYSPGSHAIDALWTLGMVLIGIGAWRARPVAAVAGAAQVGRRRGGVLPSLTFLLVLAVELAHIAPESAGAELALDLGVGAVGLSLVLRAGVLRRQQAELFDRLHGRERELREANDRLSRESRVDPLTGVANRLRLREDFRDLAARAQRYGQGYCLVLCDLDRFKAYNDEAGHQAGDAVLRQVAQILDVAIREGDRVYRYGGEELLLVLPEQDAESGRAVADRHRAALERRALPHPRNTPWGVVTFSAGVAAAEPGESPDAVLRRADRALYDAKAGGRNRVAVAGAPRIRAAA